MERLTGRDELGNAYYKKCFEEPCAGIGCMIDGCRFQDEEACSALALYEDTGVNPDKLAIIGEEYSKMAKELAKYRWIPVTERLPEDGTYLCVLAGELVGEEDPFTGMCGFYNGKWDEEGCVLAWMPLPEPYKDKIVMGSKGVSEG